MGGQLADKDKLTENIKEIFRSVDDDPRGESSEAVGANNVKSAFLLCAIVRARAQHHCFLLHVENQSHELTRRRTKIGSKQTAPTP